jgi:hypothetical protein
MHVVGFEAGVHLDGKEDGEIPGDPGVDRATGISSAAPSCST